MTLSDIVTVLIPSSFVPSHPSITLVRNAIESIRIVLALPNCKIVVCCDGPPECPNQRRNYSEYKSRLRDFSATNDVHIAELPVHVGLPGVIAEGFNHVSTPLALVFQHDFEVVRAIRIDELCRVLLQDDLPINHVRLNHKDNRQRKCDRILREFNHPHVLIPLLRTNCWSDMPHLARSRYYRETVLPRMRPTQSRLGVENQLARLLRADIERLGFDAGHRRHGTCVYGRLGDPPVVLHLDGRRIQSVDETPKC